MISKQNNFLPACLCSLIFLGFCNFYALFVQARQWKNKNPLFISYLILRIMFKDCLISINRVITCFPRTLLRRRDLLPRETSILKQDCCKIGILLGVWQMSLTGIAHDCVHACTYPPLKGTSNVHPTLFCYLFY